MVGIGRRCHEEAAEVVSDGNGNCGRPKFDPGGDDDDDWQPVDAGKGTDG